MIIANCIDPRFAISALVKESSLETLKNVMSILIHHERYLNQSTLPEKQQFSLKRKSLFDILASSEIKSTSDIADIDVIENEIFIYKSEVRLVT